MKDISTSIFIAAKPDRIWRHLTAFSRYAAWNPFIVAIAGERMVGERITATLKLKTPDGRGEADHEINATIVKIEDEHEIRWEHGSWFPGMIDCEHWMRIAPCKGGVKFHQNMRVTGLMTGLLQADYVAMYRLGFEAMNAALKALVEASESGHTGPLPVANDNDDDLPSSPNRDRRAS